MASHRSGLPCHDFMRNKVGESRRNLMLKCANLDASAGFRETYQYNNHMYIVLGYLMEVLRGGESWESQIKRNIADKLGVETILACHIAYAQVRARVMIQHVKILHGVLNGFVPADKPFICFIILHGCAYVKDYVAK